jgi:hypothetical protein
LSIEDEFASASTYATWGTAGFLVMGALAFVQILFVYITNPASGLIYYYPPESGVQRIEWLFFIPLTNMYFDPSLVIAPISLALGGLSWVKVLRPITRRRAAAHVSWWALGLAVLGFPFGIIVSFFLLLKARSMFLSAM